MPKQLNLLSGGNVIPTSLHTEMEQSYLEYAMSVIVGRALPDVRDGLKPVHRRIIYAMHELGLTPDRPYRKCARVVGDVLGKYHPHGDQSVYDALVRMVQSFSSRYPLLDGHGNFGSVDDDPPAAMRYTETRLSGLANGTMLDNISEATVDFTENFDSSQQEPTVLPAQLPTLLLNGCSGIAVGMATNIPPHNLGEIVDALIALIDRPQLTDEALLKLVPGPDFPTGGEIIGDAGIQDAYLKGRGSIPIRAITQIEETQPGRGRHRRSVIIITELPFQVNKAGLLEKIAALINQGKIEGIADLRDESDRDGMRVVIELKRETQPEAILEQLFRQTQLQSNFGVIMLAIVDGQPRQLTLKEALSEFLRFREQTLQREYHHQLEQTQLRSHIVEGLLVALTDIDQVIDILRNAPDGSTAKVNLQTDLDLSDRQADAILAMPLRRLTGMEQEKIKQEFDTLQSEIAQLQSLIHDRSVFLKNLKKELRTLKKLHGDPRRTRIRTAEEAQVLTAPVNTNQPVTLEITQKGYIRAVSQQSRSRRKAQPEPSKKLLENNRDLWLFKQPSELDDQLLLFTASGKAFSLNLREVPLSSGRERGVPLVTLLPESTRDDEITSFKLNSQLKDDSIYVFLTTNGKIKSLPASEFNDMTNRGLTCLKLQSGDALKWVLQVNEAIDILISTSAGRVLRFPSEEVPIMGRAAQGSKALRLLKQEQIAGVVALSPDEEVLLVSKKGFVKRFSLDILRQGHPGDLGTALIQGQKSDAIIQVAVVQQTHLIRVTSQDNQVAYLDPAAVTLTGKTEPTTAWFKTKPADPLVDAIALPAPEID